MIVGDLNIADWVTRGKSPGELGPCGIWQTGQEFVKQPVEKWPVSSQANIEKLPKRHKVVMITNAKKIETLATRINIGRFSKIELLLNTTARILKLYKRYKKSAEQSLGSAVEMNKLTVADIDSPERFWIKDAQESIAKEVREGKFIRLCPKYKDGLIVVDTWTGGALNASYLEEARVQPSST